MKLHLFLEGKTIQFSQDVKDFLDEGMSLITKRISTQDYKWVAQNIHNSCRYPIGSIENWAKTKLKEFGEIPLHPVFHEMLLRKEVDPGEQYGDIRQISLYISKHSDRGQNTQMTTTTNPENPNKQFIDVYLGNFGPNPDPSEIRYALVHELAHAIDPKRSVSRWELPWKKTNKRIKGYNYEDDPIEIDPLVKQYAMWYIDRGIESLMGQDLTYEEALDSLRHRNIASLKGMGGFRPAKRILYWKSNNKTAYRKFMREVYDYLEAMSTL